jgi:hypothetical protein
MREDSRFGDDALEYNRLCVTAEPEGDVKHLRRLQMGRLLVCLAATLLVAVPLAGCGNGATQSDEVPTEGAVVEDAAGEAAAEQPRRQSEPTPVATFSAEQLSVCDDLLPEFAAGLGLSEDDLTVEGADWVDMADESVYMGCRTAYVGPGEKLGVGPNSYMAPAHNLRALFSSHGWEEDALLAADGPGASFFGFRGESEVCSARVSFAAPEGTDCTDQDPVTCGLPPAEQIYTIEITCALNDEAVEE